VQTAAFIGASEAGNINGDFCKVTGVVKPRNPSLPNLEFEVNLPQAWNRRALQMGGGGYDGSLVTGGIRMPIARGLGANGRSGPSSPAGRERRTRRLATRVFGNDRKRARFHWALASISDVASATRLNWSGLISEMLATTERSTVTRNVLATAGFRL
jgi:hypothetical protein